MTSDAQIQPDCITKTIAGNWLTNGHLEICILKLIAPSENQWQNDESRVENIAIVASLLQASSADTSSLLEDEAPSKPMLILAPELAFGSQDYEQLNSLIHGCTQNVIFICGFGFSTGEDIISIENNDNVEGVWDRAPNANKKFNGGWVWVKEADNTQCFIILKNFPEQAHELSIPNLGLGEVILRLESSDLVIFPTICSDLISAEVSSPRKRIASSLDGACNKKILITGSLLNQNSSSGWWKTAMGDLLESVKETNPRLLLSNCLNPAPLPAEEEDKWRCLSGGYQHLEGSKAPKKSLANIRYVADTKFSGLVVRTPDIGCIFGKLNWTNNQAEGLAVLSHVIQHIWYEDKYLHCDGDPAADELHRFIQRYQGNVYDSVGFSNDARILADDELEKLLSELSPKSKSPIRKVAGLLFRKCLKGINKDEIVDVDSLHSNSGALESAITTLVLIKDAINAELMPEMPKGSELDYGQLLSPDHESEILIWDSSEHTAKQLYNMVIETLVKDGGSARPLTIIGKGNGHGSLPVEGRMKSGRLSDITNVTSRSPDDSQSDKDICESNDRVVFWKNQGSVDDVLSSNEQNQNLKNNLKDQIGLSESQ
ncbi:MAG: hypothetical protein COA96_01315 [SAR86 cluster bacterium]|uniref:ABC-three component systems C-terminal domain-containing protein n=1 Tax=SAR86 cluster bacterium TaxID=2030880 RepID=A0A2A5BAY5_9GAMM|nr:MAG: hypothetical protein COA96_01315 [SAR86 cluster bacterium]